MIGIETEGIPEVREKLKRLGSKEPMRDMNKGVAQYIREELQRAPAPRRVTRKQAFGKTFQSDRQRKWFFASLADGSLVVPHRRTGRLRKGWEIMPFGPTNYIVVNDTPGAKFVQDRPTQSRMMKIIGWKTMQDIIERRRDRIRQIANGVYDKWIRKLGL